MASPGHPAAPGSVGISACRAISLDDPPIQPCSVGILSHNHPFAYVYAERGPHGLKYELVITEVFADDAGHMAGQQETIVSTLRQGEGAAVRFGSNHVHEASSGRYTFWETLLGVPD